MKNIVILATGGTIAGAGEQGKDIGYKSGSIKAQALIDAIPELKNVANICVEHLRGAILQYQFRRYYI